MTYPEVRFHKNKGLDRFTVFQFLGSNAAGINFAEGIFHVHPAMRQAILGYIDEFYKDHDSVLAATARTFKSRWETDAMGFFSAVEKVFRHHRWPDGKYVGYVSIFDCNPRFLEDKTFQVFYRHKAGPVYVTAHELLHFMFYDYVEKQRRDVRRQLAEESLWRLSEVVNDVLFDADPFRRFVGPSPPEGYPELRLAADRLRQAVGDRSDIERLISAGLRIPAVIAKGRPSRSRTPKTSAS